MQKYLQAVTPREHILCFLEKSANFLSETVGSQKLDIAIYYSWLSVKSVTQYSVSIAKTQGRGRREVFHFEFTVPA